VCSSDLDHHQLHDYLNTLKEERDKLVKAHHIKTSIAGKPDNEQARIIKELHKQVKPEQKGETTDEETEEVDDKTKG
jgi:hypothetical protein